MSFIEMEDIIRINEGLLRLLWKQVKGVEVGVIPHMTFQEAMDRYGSDKPDIRFGMEIQDFSAQLNQSGFKVFDDVLARKGIVRGLVVPGGKSYSRGQFDKLMDIAKKGGAKGLVWVKQDDAGEWQSPASKFLSADKFKMLYAAAKATPQDALLIVADDFEPACSALSALRLHIVAVR